MGEPRLRFSRALTALAAVLFPLGPLSCSEPTEDPGAGQTGSPVVPPDYGSPVPFRPRPEPDNPGGESPELPHVPLPGPAPERSARFGNWLYLALPEGTFAVDIAAPEAAAALPLLPGVLPEWIGVDGQTLVVVGRTLADDPAQVEAGPITRVYQLDLSQNPAEPALLGSLELPGSLYRVRSEAGRLVALQAIFPAQPCRPQRTDTWNEGRSWPERFRVMDLRTEPTGYRVHAEVEVEGEGFVETAQGFVLTHGIYSDPVELTVVELTAEGLAPWPSVNLEGPVAPRAPMATGDQRLAVLQPEPSGLSLAVWAPGAASPKLGSLPLPPSLNAEGGQSATGLRVAGSFVLVPAMETDGVASPGLVIDWNTGTAPSVVAELPAGVTELHAVGDRWLGLASDRSVLFGLTETGSVQLEAEWEVAPGNRANIGFPLHWDAASTSAFLPYLVSGTGIGDTPAEYGIGVLDLAAEPSWSAGPRTFGRPSLVVTGWGTAREISGLIDTDAGWFALTDGGADISNFHWLLEAIDPASPESHLVALQDRVVGAAMGESGRAELLVDHEGNGRVRVQGQSPPAQSFELGYGSRALRSFEAGWAAFSLQYSNACSPGIAPGELGECVSSGQPALSLLAGAPPELESDVPLPPPDSSAAEFVTNEWLEVVVQGEQISVLERRGVRCRTESECNALGAPFEVIDDSGGSACADGADVCDEQVPSAPRVSGNQDQRWLYPFDRSTGAFTDPLRLPDANGHSWLSAEGLSTNDPTTLVLSTALEIATNGYDVSRSRFELVRVPAPTDSAAAVERITVPGVPVFVDGERAISIEPSGPVVDGAVAARVHRLSLRDGAAYLDQTLELPAGHAGHLWAASRGYVLLLADDRCADPTVTLLSLELGADGTLTRGGEIQLPGTEWQIAQASDERVLLTRSIGGLNQHAVIEAAPGELTLGRYETRAASAPVSLFGDQVWVGSGR